MKNKDKIVNNEAQGLENDSASPKKLNEDELKMLEASKSDFDRNTLPAFDNSDFAKAKRFAKKNKFTVLFVSLTIVLLVATVALLIVMAIKSNQNSPCTDDFSITVGDNAPYTISYGDATIDGVFYFDVRSIATYAGLQVTGGSDSISLWCSDGTYVRFENDSKTATVNGTRVFVEGTTKIITATDKSSGKCLVPISFVQKLFSFEVEKGWPGLKVTFNESNNSLKIKRIMYQNTQLFLPISFSADCFENAENDNMI